MYDINPNADEILAEEEYRKTGFDPQKLHKLPNTSIPAERLVADNIEELTKQQRTGKPGRPKQPNKPFDLVEVDENNHIKATPQVGRPTRELVALRKGKVSDDTMKNIATQYFYNPDWHTVALLTGHTADFLITFSKTLKFHELLSEIRNELDAREQAAETTIIEDALVELQDRIKHGDEILDSKTGTVKKVKMKGKELASTLKVIHTVRQVTRETSKEKEDLVSQADKLHALATNFAKFASAKTIEGETS